ncbi:hypothetical protein AAG747_19075 [Rapidithrix thailandica]|uniref:SMI1/KNR4 family protein n=1 Tax=Rapidithrix thailandica TaxID=413964 RepID=A0AAW9RYP0_9BACT
MEELTNKYKEVFGKYPIPETLKKLMDFEKQYGGETYSECFYLCVDLDKTPDMGQYSLDGEYFERLMVFANADGTGAKYAFWANEMGISLEEAPIIVIGSEGHIQVMAKNLKELLRLLSFGPETMDGEFYKDLDDFEDPENATEFREWMISELNVRPIEKLAIDDSEEVNTIVKEAVQTYGEPFKEWMMSLTPQYASFDEYD